MTIARAKAAIPFSTVKARLTGALGYDILSGFSLLLLVLLARGSAFTTSIIDPDESIFALAAREVLHGHLPYTTFFDVKPIGSTLLIAAAFKLFGESILVLRLTGATCVWISSMLIGRLCRQCGLPQWQAFCASVLYIVFASSMHGLATMTEIMDSPFTILSVMLLWRLPEARLFTRMLMLTFYAGLACGTAILIKTVPLVPCAMVLGLVLQRALWNRDISFIRASLLAIVFFLASATPTLLAGLVYWRSGELAEYIYSNFGFARSYVAIGGSVREVARHLVTVVYALWPLLGLAAISAYGMLRKYPRGHSDIQVLGITWLLGELIAASLSMHFYPHYFLSALPPATLLAVLGIETLAAWFGPGVNPIRVASVLTVLVGLFPLQRTIVDNIPSAFAHNDIARKAATVIRQADDRRNPRLFVTTQKFVVLYSLTGSNLPTRYAIPAFLFSGQHVLIKQDPAVVVARILSHRPDFIVSDSVSGLPSWAVAAMNPVLSCCYQKLARVNDLVIYHSRHRISKDRFATSLGMNPTIRDAAPGTNRNIRPSS